MTRLAALFAAGLAIAAEKPRVFITESQTMQLTGDAAVGDVKGSLLVSGNSSPANIEVMKQFSRLCPAVTVTANREKADYLIRFDHEGANPTTPFVKGNKVAVFNRDEDLVYSDSTRLLANAVRNTCAAVAALGAR